MNLPAIPVEIADNDPHVEFALIECRECHVKSGWVRIERDDQDRIIEHPGTWHAEHVRLLGKLHAKFYQYTLTRNPGRTAFL